MRFDDTQVMDLLTTKEDEGDNGGRHRTNKTTLDEPHKARQV